MLFAAWRNSQRPKEITESLRSHRVGDGGDCRGAVPQVRVGAVRVSVTAAALIKELGHRGRRQSRGPRIVIRPIHHDQL